MARVVVHNTGAIDRAIRIVVGLGLLALAFVGPKTMWGFLGLIPLATGLIGTCPLYTVFGLSTCPLDKTTGGGSKLA